MVKAIPAHLQTPILKSVKDKLYELKTENGHESPGETIGWLIDETERLQKIVDEG